MLPAVTLPGSFLEVEFNRRAASTHWQTHAKALGVDQVGFGRQTYEPDVMAAKQQLRCEQRAIGRAQDENVVRRAITHLPRYEMAILYLKDFR